MSAQQAVAKAFVGEGVAVLFDSVVPRADLDNRVIHLRPMPEEVSHDEMVDIRADCDHELGHFLYTDASAFRGIDREMVKLLTNAIEDGFVERRHGENYLGVSENLAESNARQFAEIKKTASSTVLSRRARALTSLMMFAAGHSETEVYETLLDDISPYIEKIRDILPRLAGVRSSWDSRDLAVLIADRWCWDSPEDHDGDGVPTGASRESPTTDTTQESPAAASTDEVNSAGGEPTESPAASRTADTPSSHELDRKGEDAQAEQLSPELLTSRRKHKISKMDMRRTRVYRAKKDNDVESNVPASSTTVSDKFATFMSSVRQIADPLRRRLLMEFRGPGLVMRRHQRRGEVDQRSLHKVLLKDPNVFEDKVRDVVINRDITLMVDCSGSMLSSGEVIGPFYSDSADMRDRTRLWVAAQAACACSIVLDLIGVTHEVLAWTTRGKGVKNSCYERVTPLWHMVVKPAASSFHSCQRNFVNLALFDTPAENIDGEAVLWGALRLAERARRAGRDPLLIVFSDGEPLSTPEDASVLSWHLSEVVERVERAGITTLGVGIQTESVSSFYPRWTVVNDLDDLVGRFYELLRTELRNSAKYPV